MRLVLEVYTPKINGTESTNFVWMVECLETKGVWSYCGLFSTLPTIVTIRTAHPISNSKSGRFSFQVSQLIGIQIQKSY